jgi:hypothetical protein
MSPAGDWRPPRRGRDRRKPGDEHPTREGADDQLGSAAARPRADAAHSILIRDHIRTAWLTTLQPLLGENPHGCLATSYSGLR